MHEWTTEEKERYAKQVTLCEWGWAAQEKLKQKSVLIVGAGALGCAALPYLIGAGLGRVDFIDDDTIERSNLHRQVLYGEEDIGQRKVDIAKQNLARLNPYVNITAIPKRLIWDNAEEIVEPYDLILDATDRFSSREIIDTVCHRLKKPWIHASIDRFVGQVAFFTKTRYSDLFPGPLTDDMAMGCSEGGVLGPIAGIMGSIQALEALQWLGGIESAADKLIRFDALTFSMQVFTFGPLEEKLSLTIEDLDEWTENERDYLLIDVRQPEERINGHLGGKMIPFAQIFHAPLPKDKPIVLYCQSGIRSTAAAKRLREERSLLAYSLEGGLRGLGDSSRIHTERFDLCGRSS